MNGSTATPKLVVYAVIASVGLLAAVAAQQTALAALAAPFALVVVLGAALYRVPHLTVRVEPVDGRVLEDDTIEVDVVVACDRPIDRLEVLLVPNPGFIQDSGSNPRAVDLSSGGERRVSYGGQPRRWGVIDLADVVVRSRDRMGLFVREAHFVGNEPVRVYPRVEALRHLVRPFDTQVLAGNQTAREKAEGVEFADLRVFVPGDRMRDVNWRVTARRGSMWVNQRHPDRNADVVLFLDSFTEEYLDDAVRAASMLVSKYLHNRDRVGLVSFGGTVRWLHPGVGLRQLYRIVDALVESKIFENVAWKDISALPARVVPPKALILAVSPLDDARVVEALLQLRRRRHDVAVIEIAPSQVHRVAGEAGDLAWRLWQLDRRNVRDRFQSLGAAVVEWREAIDAESLDRLLTDPHATIDPAVLRRGALDGVEEELRAFRRRTRQAG